MSLLPLVHRDAPSVRRLSFGEAPTLRSWLLRDVARHSFLLGWLHENDVLPIDPDHRFQFLGALQREQLIGVSLLAGNSIAVVHGDGAAATALGAFHRRVSARLQTIIGPRESVEPFWQAYAGSSLTSRPVRRQVLLDLRARELRYFPEPLVELAEPEDLNELFQMSVAMHEEETGLPLHPSERDVFRRNVAQRIEAGRTWCLRDPFTGQLTFKASVASWSPEVAQVEGVFVRPAWRGGGVARRALSEMLRRVLYTVDRVTLYADETNAPALKLYRRLGFREAGQWMTIDGGQG
jgi:RimJ/RimL family protein N-acetyltransferase